MRGPDTRELPASKAAAGHGPCDVQAVAPEDLSTETGLADGVQARDWLAGVIECLKLLVDGGSALGRREVRLCGTEQRPLLAAKERTIVCGSLLVGLGDRFSE